MAGKEDVIKEYFYKISIDFDEKELDRKLSRITDSFDIFFGELDKLFAKDRIDFGIPDIKNNRFYDASAINAMKEQAKAEKKQKEAEREAERAKKAEDRDMMKAANVVRKDVIKKMKEDEKSKKGVLMSLAGGPKGLLTKSFYGMVAYKAIETMSKGFKMIEKSTTETSNKFVRASSMFVDKNIRDAMIKYGVDSPTAIGMTKTMDLLGIDQSDLMKLTPAQAKAYKELMSQYFEGMNSLNGDRLKSFNKGMQEYQLNMAKFKMTMEINKMRFFANNSKIITDFFETIVTMADALATILRPILAILKPILWGAKVNAEWGPVGLISKGIDWLGNQFNSGSNKNVNVTQNITNNVNEGTLDNLNRANEANNRALKRMFEGGIE